jgi:hypothetical protein
MIDAIALSIVVVNEYDVKVYWEMVIVDYSSKPVVISIMK